MVLVAPGAEITSALAVLFSTLRVRTGSGPEGYVASLATLQRTSACVWHHAEAHRAWRKGQSVSRPRHEISLHSFPPSLLRAGALLPADARGMEGPLVRGTQYERGHMVCVTWITHRSRGINTPRVRWVMYLHPAVHWLCTCSLRLIATGLSRDSSLACTRPSWPLSPDHRPRGALWRTL
jgi:hypothetical protein